MKIAHRARYWRLMNEAPTVLMILIVIMVVVKPFLNTVELASKLNFRFIFASPLAGHRVNRYFPAISSSWHVSTFCRLRMPSRSSDYDQHRLSPSK